MFLFVSVFCFSLSPVVGDEGQTNGGSGTEPSTREMPLRRKEGSDSTSGGHSEVGMNSTGEARHGSAKNEDE